MSATVQSVKRRPFVSLYSKGEELFNAVSHIVGGAFGIVIWVVLVYFTAGNARSAFAVSAFAFGVVLLYTMSALYHFLPSGRAKGILRLFDHTTIYVLIAGTYTPYCLIALDASPLALGILISQWVLALLGIMLHVLPCRDHKAAKGVCMALYVIMGWMIMLAVRPLLLALTAWEFWLLLSGGIAYTVGIAFYALSRKVRYFHAVWHLFVLLGTVLQFASILLLVL